MSTTVRRRLGQIAPHVKSAGRGTTDVLLAREKDGHLGGVLTNLYWASTTWRFSGRAWPLLPVLVYVGYLAVVVGLGIHYDVGGDGGDGLVFLEDLVTYVGLLVFLLLTFRNTSAYSRWNEGAIEFANLCELSREVAATGAVMMAHYDRVRAARFVLWCSVYVEAVLMKLRAGGVAPPAPLTRLRGIVPRDMLEQADAARSAVGHASAALHAEMHGVVLKVLESPDSKPSAFTDMGNIHRDFAMRKAALVMSYAALKRILLTPTPLAYVAHVRAVMWVWLAALPFVFVPYCGWGTLPICALVAFFVVGVEEVAVTVEQPFGEDYNDINLDRMVFNAHAALLDLVATRCRPPPGALPGLLDVGAEPEALRSWEWTPVGEVTPAKPYDPSNSVRSGTSAKPESEPSPAANGAAHELPI